ncbi:sigma factor-like helix-turn-helix DNA-binding protein [Micromonospora sp. IBHARD004]|uniref:sigma factor-like helix-turn-helix DNA-binding protein n=1 Tax=Micromonospora sp. IBHARD004 TaxID=3457764 RepID=UPI00405932F8
MLREVFDVPHDEIAEAVGKSSAAVRQIAHRARRHVAARRPRMEVSRTEQQQVVEQFRAALTTGDVQGLMAVLAPDVVLVSDGGGLVPAARKPIEGADKLAAVLAFGATKVSAELTSTPVWLNGAPGALIDIDGEVAAAVSLTVENGRITRIYAILNPHKLAWLDAEAALAR